MEKTPATRSLQPLKVDRLVDALSKSQNILGGFDQQSKPQEMNQDSFIENYMKDLQQNSNTAQKNLADRMRRGSLELRGVDRNPNSSSKMSPRPNENVEALVNNGRPWRRPLHPEKGQFNNLVPLTHLEPNTTEAVGTSSFDSKNPEELDEGNDTLSAGDSRFAVCPNCGGLSEDYIYCERCHKLLPRDVKTYVKPISECKSPPKRNYKPNANRMQDECKSPPEKQAAFSSAKFYGNNFSKPRQQEVIKVNPAPKVHHPGVIKRVVGKKSQYWGTPECLTISSDEDEGHKEHSSATADNEEPVPSPRFDAGEPHSPPMPNTGEPIPESESERLVVRRPRHVNSQVPGIGTRDEDLVSTSRVSPRLKLKRPRSDALPVMQQDTSLACRSIRIGNYKMTDSCEVSFTVEGLSINAQTIGAKERVTLTLNAEDLVQVISHFGKQIPVIFLYTTPGCAGSIQSRLKMVAKCGTCYNPSSSDETLKRIVILPERITDNQIEIIRHVFRSIGRKVKNDDLCYEVDGPTANNILCRSIPNQLQNVVKVLSNSPLLAPPSNDIWDSPETPDENEETKYAPSMPTVKLMTYPPPPQTGGITITTDDYCCLDEGQFLNDVIIDFYLKYLVQNVLSEEDRRRTHIFSSFFYRRLTQRPIRRYAQAEEQKNIGPAETRHNRVRTWTRHVDIFEKDFIIIPINEHSHWFLAVICFPYLTGAMAFADRPVLPRSPATTAAASDQLETSNMSECNANNSTCEAYEEDAEVPMDTSEPEESSVPPSPVSGIVGPVIQPCILIFDSLPGPSRTKLIATLREYLSVEWKVKKKTERVFDRFTIRGSNPKVPFQDNYSDCGIYVLQYVESFFEAPIMDYSTPIQGLQNWFADERASNKRTELQMLIRTLSSEQHDGKDLLAELRPEEDASSENVPMAEAEYS